MISYLTKGYSCGSHGLAATSKAGETVFKQQEDRGSMFRRKRGAYPTKPRHRRSCRHRVRRSGSLERYNAQNLDLNSINNEESTLFDTLSTAVSNMCWGAGLPSSGKLAELRDMGVGSNVAYFDFLVFIIGNCN